LNLIEILKNNPHLKGSTLKISSDKKFVSNLAYLKFNILLCFLIFSAALPCISIAKIDERDSMVKIYSVQNEPDYDNPWNMSGPESSSGSGCVIQGNRILTNAHVVSDQTFIQVRQHGQAKKYQARVVAVSHEADLALLTVDEPSFFSEVKSLQIGTLPEVQQEVVVYGFPEGGDSLSTTKGVISRIEHHKYVHSRLELLAAQLDAAINSGNSGGPVIVGNRIVGVVMQSREKSENIGYMIPVPVIKHFLIDLEDGKYDGFPVLGVSFQHLENDSLRAMNGMRDEQTGALVVSTVPGTPAYGNLFPGDVILSVDGHQVANDCTVEFRRNDRTHLKYYVQQHQIGEELNLNIHRTGHEKSINLTLNRTWENNRLVPMLRYDVPPTYYVYGGLVFCPLTLNYILTWGDDWAEYAPYNLLNYYKYGKNNQVGEEVVIIIKALLSDVNNGYEDFIDKRIVQVNGKNILNLRELISIVESDSEKPFMVLKTEDGKIIALDRKKVKEKQA